MGRSVAEAVTAADGMVLAAAVDPSAPGSEVCGVEVLADVDALVEVGIDVAVDFTVAEASRSNLPVLAAAGVHAVVGTSGLDEADVGSLRAAFTSSNCLIAPNFAIGAVLMMRFAELAAPWFDTAEIVEVHHDGKVDAPSGTAVATAERMAAASAASILMWVVGSSGSAPGPSLKPVVQSPPSPPVTVTWIKPPRAASCSRASGLGGGAPSSPAWVHFSSRSACSFWLVPLMAASVTRALRRSSARALPSG